MKKVLSFLLISFLLVSAFSLSSCNEGSEGNGGQTQAADKADEAKTEAASTGAEPTDKETKEDAKDQSKDSYTIGLSISTLDNPFFVDLRDGAEAKAKELGLELIITDSQNDSAKEMSNIEDLITRKVDLILINPTDSDAVGNAVLAANDAKIPVITLDRSSTEGEVLCHIASDNVAGGKMAGEFILKQLKDKATDGSKIKLVELEGIPGASATRDRGEGFNAALDEADIAEVLTRQTANFDRTEGLNVMENILQAQPEIDAVFAHNDEMALGAIEAIKASGRDILVVGFDATDDAVKAVNDGFMAATVQQLPKEIGAKGVIAAKEYLEGKAPEAYLPVPLELVVKHP